MPWIESHTVLGRHKKVKETARALRIRPAYLIGHLHLLWHNALEQAEDGDLSRWTEEFIAESADYPGDAPQFVRLLQDHKWLDGRLLHDWIDYAGRYLIGKYAKDERDRLAAIWSKHGRIYGKNHIPNRTPSESQPDPNKNPSPSLGGLGEAGSSPPGEKREEEGGTGETGGEEGARTFFNEAREAYPGRKRGLSVEWLNFTKKHPDYRNILPLLLLAIEAQAEYRSRCKAAKAFVPAWPHLQTWVNQSRWTEEGGEINGTISSRQDLQKTMDNALAGLGEKP